MFEVSVEAEFCAAHAITIAGEREPLHGHNFRVTLTIAGPALDADGLLCDFHQVERALGAVIEPFRDRPLNGTPPFDRVSPSAERVAEHIGEGVAGRLRGALPRGARVASVRVTEAAGCAATYRPTTV